MVAAAAVIAAWEVSSRQGNRLTSRLQISHQMQW